MSRTIREMSDRPKVAYNEMDVITAIKVLHELEDGLDFLVWLKKYRGVNFSVILIHGNKERSWIPVIERVKRKTDILFKIDENLYVVIAQETHEEGLRVFAMKVLRAMMTVDPDSSPFASAIDVEDGGEDLSARKIIFDAVKGYVEFFQQPKPIRKGRVEYRKI